MLFLQLLIGRGCACEKCLDLSRNNKFLQLFLLTQMVTSADAVFAEWICHVFGRLALCCIVIVALFHSGSRSTCPCSCNTMLL